jgi:hypothetical protein
VTGSERDAHVAERANRILRDDRTAADHARFVEAQLRGRRMRKLSAGLRKLFRILMIAAVLLLSSGTVAAPVSSPPPAEGTGPGNGR